jgi:uncharacterized protein
MLKLTAPRATFPGDMTGDEAQMMADHVAYWSSLVEPAGPVLVFGPVADPAGTWCTAVIKAPDVGTVWALIERDPIKQRGEGFKYDVFRMPDAISSSGT